MRGSIQLCWVLCTASVQPCSSRRLRAFKRSDLLRRRVLSPSLRGPARAVRFAAGRWGAEYVRRIFFADMLFRLRACDLRCGSTECLLC